MATNIHGNHSGPSSSRQPFPTPQQPPMQAASPPTKANLKSWWAGFRKESKKQEAQGNYSLRDQEQSPGGDAFARHRSPFASLSSRPHAVQFRESSMDEPRTVSSRYASMSHTIGSSAPDTTAGPFSLSESDLGAQRRSVADVDERARNLLSKSSQHRAPLHRSLSNLWLRSNAKRVRQERPASAIGVSGTSLLRTASTSIKAEKCPREASELQVQSEQSEASDAVLAGIEPPTKPKLFSHLFAVFKIKRAMSFAKLTGKTAETTPGIFGVPLRTSIAYANVAISLVDADGKSYIYGYVPIVVAKCGVYLKEKATNVEGIFRLSGSEKRIKELKGIFDAPERYGKGLDWAGYTVHDAANVLRRYLNQLPEPIVPLDLYDRFRDPLRGHTMQAVGDNEGPQLPDSFNVNKAITTYQQLITELPPLNRQLLLYILDLLAVFASKSDENRMNSQNLAAIFQPGMLSHPSHDMAPSEYRLSQDVLIFLIENQDHFLIGMRGTAADEKTVQEVQAGVTPPGTPKTPRNVAVVRTASNASAGAESIRKFGVRRNVSVSSRNSKQSNGAPSPASPALSHTTSSGLNRSNTVPSKRSPGLPNNRLQKNSASPSPTGPIFGSAQIQPRGLSPAARAKTDRNASPSPARFGLSTHIGRSGLAPSSHAESAVSQERLLADQSEKQEFGTPQKERNVSSFFNRSPTIDNEKKPPNKLRKKQRQPSSNPSAQSSTNSLHAPQPLQLDASSPTTPPSAGPSDAIPECPVLETIPSEVPSINSDPDAADATPPATQTPRPEYVPQQISIQQAPQSILEQQSQNPVQQPAQQSAVPEEHIQQPQTNSPSKLVSPPSSVRSRSSFNDQSDADHREESAAAIEQREKRSRWRISRHRDTSNQGNTLTPRRGLGSDICAGQSSSSVGTPSLPRKSFTGDTVPVGSESTLVTTHPQSSNESHAGSNPGHEEKKGPLGWIKSKMREKRAESEQKERNKSPPAATDRIDTFAPRGKSVDIKREEFPRRVIQEPNQQQAHEQHAPTQPYPQQTQIQQYQPYRPPPAAQEPPQ